MFWSAVARHRCGSGFGCFIGRDRQTHKNHPKRCRATALQKKVNLYLARVNRACFGVRWLDTALDRCSVFSSDAIAKHKKTTQSGVEPPHSKKRSISLAPSIPGGNRSQSGGAIGP